MNIQRKRKINMFEINLFKKFHFQGNLSGFFELRKKNFN